jgi:hypothetical protein
MNETKKRSKVAILLSSKPDFDEIAFKYFVLNLNSNQSLYEFTFPEIDAFYYLEKDYSRESLFKIHKKESSHIYFESTPEYYINIVKAEIEGNLFFICRDNVTFITTNSWEKLYSPPSLFEYLLHGISVSLIAMHPQIGIMTHSETRGCTLDYTKYKADRRIDISLGYICDNCRSIILKQAGKEYLDDICKIINREWIGDINTFDSVAYNLKRFFRFDINKDSGFNKTWWEKFKNSLSDAPKEIFVGVILVLVAAIIGLLFANSGQ